MFLNVEMDNAVMDLTQQLNNATMLDNNKNYQNRKVNDETCFIYDSSKHQQQQTTSNNYQQTMFSVFDNEDEKMPDLYDEMLN